VFLRLPGLKNRNNIELFLSIKINPMKIQIIILGAMVLVGSCNTNPNPGDTPTDSTRMAADTAGLAEFQAMKAQNELGIQNEEKQDESSSKKVKKNRNISSSTSSNNKSEQAGNATSTTSTQKKGWSKTAKGAAMGGVAGATGGAVINKKNRVAGAVIGGVIGAGTGAVIGNEMDKKDGRH
jgi:hypothetical protein